jgi:hypothetical protein
LTDDQRDDPASRDDRQCRDERRGEPVLLLPLVEHDLQRTDPEHQHPHAPVVDAFRLAPEVRGIEHIEMRHDQRDDPDWQIDVEHPSPAVVLGDPPAEDRSEDRRDDDAETPEAHGAPAILWLEGFEQDGLRERLERSAGRALNDAEEHERRQVRRRATEKRRQREAGSRPHQQPLAAEPARQPAGHRQDDGVGDEIRRQGPGRFVGRR